MFANTRFGRVLAGLTALGTLALASPMATAGQAIPPAIRDLTNHIRTISPHWGPVGTAVRFEATGLPPNVRVQVAVGEMQGCGYQVCQKLQTNSRGELSATVEVPDWAHTQHYEVVMILSEDFVPIAVSDPFHVTDADGMVEREGVIGLAWPGCASLVGDHGVTYGLVGEKARTMQAAAGHRMMIKGRITEGVCAQAFGLEVESMEMAPDGR